MLLQPTGTHHEGSTTTPAGEAGAGCQAPGGRADLFVGCDGEDEVQARLARFRTEQGIRCVRHLENGTLPHVVSELPSPPFFGPLGSGAKRLTFITGRPAVARHPPRAPPPPRR